MISLLKLLWDDTLVDFIIFLFLILFYFYYQHKQNQHDSFFQETPKNSKIYEYLKTKLNQYSPTIYLPNPLASFIIDSIKYKKCISHKNIYYKHPIDNEELEMNAFPADSFENSNSPIIYFIYGVFGTPDKNYV